ncbi:MAG TPA: sigma-70 family RNA polymerase sigma factor [Lacibacter sp.]|nr:sigma-70 family RNA polymerase sigma factor [Lacibacter sp.]HMO88036.1 sigma-70 family RNA polymerase sigma factor [Lacibacter sp.]HMP85906.1 sigma-70 family RNA polymerase sigma factor [Lacibacter sp.]
MTVLSAYEDRDLLALLRDDSREAFEEIYRRHWMSLLNAVYKRMKQSDASKDIVQDVLADLWIRRHEVKIENLSAYLHTAVRFQVFKLVARGKPAEAFSSLYHVMAGGNFTADHIVAEKELGELARAWFATLPAKRKEIFILYYRDQLPTREIARRLGLSQKTVQNQLGMASRSLWEQIVTSLLLASAAADIL